MIKYSRSAVSTADQSDSWPPRGTFAAVVVVVCPRAVAVVTGSGREAIVEIDTGTETFTGGGTGSAGGGGCGSVYVGAETSDFVDISPTAAARVDPPAVAEDETKAEADPEAFMARSR
jgi:hypothetical protein